MEQPRLYNPVIAVIGAGAVGGYYGARLAHNGLDVHFLLRSDYPAVREHGFTVQSCAGDFTLLPEKLHVYDDPRRMPLADLVIVTLKSTANDQFDRLIQPLLKPSTIILTVQNGFGNEDALARLFGAECVMGGICFVCINRIGPGKIAHTAHGLIRVGPYLPHIPEPGTAEMPYDASAPATGEPPAKPHFRGTLEKLKNALEKTDQILGNTGSPLQRIADLFTNHGVPCETLPDLRTGRWQKLLWNIPFNGLSAAMDQTTDRLLASPAGLELVTRLMREVIEIAAADGVVLPPDLIQKQIANTLEMGAYRTSSHIDRLEKRPLELEALWGRPLQVARAANVPAPALETLYQMLCSIDAAGRM